MAISRYRYFDKVEFSIGGEKIHVVEDWRVALRAYVAEIQSERKKAS